MTADWTQFDRARMDAEYNPAHGLATVDPYFESYLDRSLSTRERFQPETDIAYGEDPRERLDLFRAKVAGAPLVLFVHGGYWRRFSKNEFTFTVEPFVRRGAAAAIVSYPLAPEATLDRIVASVRQAVVWLHFNAHRTNAATGRIVAAGHSAGGQLVAMLAATDWGSYGIARDGSVPGNSPLRAIVPISGLFDLDPIRRTYVDDWLHLDEASVRRNSPILLSGTSAHVIAAVGALESAEFRRQTHAYVAHQNGTGERARAIECAGRNHFDVLDDLATDDGPIARAVFDLL